jgi:phosphatidylglycerol lysyltransferase
VAEGAADESRARVFELVSRHGFNATSFQTLEPGYSYFFAEDACVAYVDTGRAWVVAGAPIAAPDALGELATRFAAEARANGKRCCFFATEERLQNAAGADLRSLRLGEQPIWDPTRWADMLAAHKSLREQLRRARAKGVRVRKLEPFDLDDPSTRQAMSTAIRRWLATRGMAPLHFLVQVEPFTFPEHRATFVAEVAGTLVGFAAVVPVPARAGWFLEDLVRAPDAPNGTNELLVDAVMHWAASSGCRWLTLGLAPLAGKVAPPLAAARKGSSLLYDFEGLRRFKAKLKPDSWSPIYLSYPPDQSAFVSLVDALLAFTRGGFLRFGLRSLLRGPTSVLHALTLLLVPWTAVLCLAPVERWFGSPLVKWSWASFDILLVFGLIQVLKRPSPAALALLAGMVTLDAAVTLLQALFFNLPRAEHALDYTIIFIACAGPALAALVLWGAHRTHLLSR